jgi:hypothetical protein
LKSQGLEREDGIRILGKSLNQVEEWVRPVISVEGLREKVIMLGPRRHRLNNARLKKEEKSRA